MELARELSLAKDLARAAGEKIMGIYELPHIEFEKKGDASPLTKADLGANQVIMDGLRAEFPSYGFLTEEETDDSKRLNNELVWIIDPLDGTKEFIKKGYDFTVNIGLTKMGEPILGVVYLPKKDELFYAVKGQGAFVERNKKVQKISVSNKTDPKDMILVSSKSHATENEEQMGRHFKGSLKAGSSLKGCLVAEGKADVYCRFGPVREWDICAMHAIVDGAGGIITDLSGANRKYNQKNTLVTGFIASNNKIHSKLLTIANGPVK